MDSGTMTDYWHGKYLEFIGAVKRSKKKMAIRPNAVVILPPRPCHPDPDEIVTPDIPFINRKTPKTPPSDGHSADPPEHDQIPNDQQLTIVSLYRRPIGRNV